jgi:hypothetical protein
MRTRFGEGRVRLVSDFIFAVVEAFFATVVGLY